MNETTNPSAGELPVKPLPFRQRRILGVLMEKARTTPDVYPLSLNALVNGCNQKSNRHPTMELTPEQVEDELEKMRAAGIVAEVQGGSRVAKYRHFGFDYMHVKGVEAAVMTELLLRGEQTIGELRTRASRFEPIADISTLQTILNSLIDRGLVVPLTPSGRGQLITHNLYLPEELSRLKQLAGNAATTLQPSAAQPQPVRNDSVQPSIPGSQTGASTSTRADVPQASSQPPADWAEELEFLREEVSDLRQLVEKLGDRLDRLEG